MKLTLKIRKNLVLFAVFVSLSLVMVRVFDKFNRFGPIRGHLVGTWKMGDNYTTTLYTFKPNGEYEAVTTFSAAFGQKYGTSNSDGSGVGIPCVFKGNYSVSGYTFRTFNIKRYTRHQGLDSEWTPSSDCNASNSCVSDSETMQMDKEASDPKNFSTIVSADWKIGTFQIRDPNTAQSSGTATFTLQ